MKQDGGLRVLFREHLPRAQWTSIETGATAGGVPDSEFCFPRLGIKPSPQGWIEYKFTRRGWQLPLRPAQCAWLDRRARYGGRCFVALRRKVDGSDVLYLWKGGRAARLVMAKQNCFAEGALIALFDDGPGKWDWKEIERILCDY